MARVLNGKAVKNMPWEECPKDCKEPIWRFSGNPVIKRHPVEGVARVFNSALVPFEDGFVGVFRGDGVDDIPHLYLGRSQDGINFKIDKDPIVFTNEKGERVDTYYQYDPRVIPFEDRFYVVWCDDLGGPTIAIAETKDFKTFYSYDFAPHMTIAYMKNGKAEKYLTYNLPATEPLKPEYFFYSFFDENGDNHVIRFTE